jgi:hypothetical protein
MTIVENGGVAPAKRSVVQLPVPLPQPGPGVAPTPVARFDLTDVAVMTHPEPPLTAAKQLLVGGTATVVVVTLDGSTAVFLEASGDWRSPPEVGQVVIATGRRLDGRNYASPTLFTASVGNPASFTGLHPSALVTELTPSPIEASQVMASSGQAIAASPEPTRGAMVLAPGPKTPSIAAPMAVGPGESLAWQSTGGRPSYISPRHR